VCIRFTTGFTQGVVEPSSVEKLEARVIHNAAAPSAGAKQPADSSRSSDLPPNPPQINDSALVNDYLTQVITGHREKTIGFDVRIKEGIAYVQKKKSIQWFCDRQGNLSKADLERVLAANSLKCEVPPDVQN